MRSGNAAVMMRAPITSAFTSAAAVNSAVQLCSQQRSCRGNILTLRAPIQPIWNDYYCVSLTLTSLGHTTTCLKQKQTTKPNQPTNQPRERRACQPTARNINNLASAKQPRPSTSPTANNTAIARQRFRSWAHKLSVAPARCLFVVVGCLRSHIRVRQCYKALF